MDRLHDYDINDTVLNQDTTRIKKSIDLLEGSLKSIKKLEANANGMKGLTSQAILHRTDDLERTITRLIKRLEQQIKLLQKIRKNYHDKDHALAKGYSSGGVGSR